MASSVVTWKRGYFFFCLMCSYEWSSFYFGGTDGGIQTTPTEPQQDSSMGVKGGWWQRCNWFFILSRSPSSSVFFSALSDSQDEIRNLKGHRLGVVLTVLICSWKTLLLVLLADFCFKTCSCTIFIFDIGSLFKSWSKSCFSSWDFWLKNLWILPDWRFFNQEKNLG